jgi:hypothetical protein
MSELKQNDTCHGTTIVSAFIDLYRLDSTYQNKSLRQYLELGRKLIALRLPKVIFIESHILPLVSCEADDFTTFVTIDAKTLWLMDQYAHLNISRKVKTDTGKDTVLYMILMLNKTKWMERAIALDVFKTEQFMWLDFGVFHIAQCEDTMSESIRKSCQQQLADDRIRIATCDKDIEIQTESKKRHAYRNPNFFLMYPCWYFCGGIFMGRKTGLTSFSRMVQCATEDIIQQYHTITWEINIWIQLYFHFPDMFVTFSCGGHNDEMVKLFYNR